MLPDITPLIKLMGILLIIFVPFGIWKIIEVIAWIFTHVHFNLT
jgi:hypothetical protein